MTAERRAGPVAKRAPVTVAVPGGTFVMGSATGRPDESPPHVVTVRAFRLGRTPVTRVQYARFVEKDGAPEPPWWRDPAFDAPDQPVVGVTWFEAVAYAGWLADTLGGAWRLPTEAEWERADGDGVGRRLVGPTRGRPHHESAPGYGDGRGPHGQASGMGGFGRR